MPNASLSYYPHWNTSANATMTLWDSLLDQVTMQHVVLVGMGLFVVSLALLLATLLRIRALCIRWQRHRLGREQHKPPSKPAQPMKSLIGGMIARIDELDSLTPLIVTPSSLSDELSLGLPPLPTHSISSTLTADRSPPFPRRLGAGGRVCLVPLGTVMLGRERRPPAPYVVPDYEMTISSTYRSVGTIPEVSENGTIPGSGSETSIARKATRGAFGPELDLISIDRTSGSTLERPIRGKPQSRPQTLAGPSTSNPLPSTSAAPLQPPFVHAINSGKPNGKAKTPTGSGGRTPGRESSQDSLSSILSSPLGSSVGDSASPIDTSAVLGSIADLSDSVYLASESDTSEARGCGGYFGGRITESSPGCLSAASTSGDMDNLSGTLDLDPASSRRFFLDRIEEESEGEKDVEGNLGQLGRARGTETGTSQGFEESLSALSQDPCSVLDSESNLIRHAIPRPSEGLI